MQKTKPVLHLSDDAFFECGFFMSEKIDAKISEEDITSIDGINNEIAYDAAVSFEESITALYRILEYRFPQFYDSITSESPAEQLRGSEQTSKLIHSKNATVEEAKTCRSKFVVKDSTERFAEEKRRSPKPSEILLIVQQKLLPRIQKIFL